jgi:hypothetical protein
MSDESDDLIKLSASNIAKNMDSIRSAKLARKAERVDDPTSLEKKDRDLYERLVCASIMRVESTYYNPDGIADRALWIADSALKGIKNRFRGLPND